MAFNLKALFIERDIEYVRQVEVSGNETTKAKEIAVWELERQRHG